MRAGMTLLSVFAMGLVGVLWLRHEDLQPLATVEPPKNPTTEQTREASARIGHRQSEFLNPPNVGPTISPSTMVRDPKVGTPSQAVEPVIDVTPGFEGYLSTSSTMDKSGVGTLLAQQHKQLGAESRDEAWADRVEREMREYVQSRLAQQMLDPQRIELSVVECRAAGCEIQAIGRKEDSGNPQRDFQFVVRGIAEGPLNSDFDSSSAMTFSFSLPDERVGYLTFLQRKK